MIKAKTYTINNKNYVNPDEPIEKIISAAVISKQNDKYAIWYTYSNVSIIGVMNYGGSPAENANYTILVFYIE